VKKLKTVGIQFKNIGKVYNFDPIDIFLQIGDHAVVETVRGQELGKVVEKVKEVDPTDLEHELKPVIRKATKEDLVVFEENKILSKQSIIKFKELVKNRNLPMKALECEYTLDRQKVLFYYSADDRVDFRDLLKDLASEFKVRIELRQVGPREGARFIGGIGCCGRKLCCKEHMRDFDLVTMKMAKDQSMNLNANKVTGQCGKLMCCISYEDPIYQEIRARMPEVDDIVKTPSCDGCKVVGIDYMRELVKIDDGKNGVTVWAAKEVTKVVASHKKTTEEIDAELKELEG
jgi:cell fate regulator YaaT (PSP1 superfamily)